MRFNVLSKTRAVFLLFFRVKKISTSKKCIGNNSSIQLCFIDDTWCLEKYNWGFCTLILIAHKY